ncbi:B-box zinc finger protein [Clostridium perfringens]|uniref:B-box zinc finger protein n=3 Tax=Clostridium perfringens TaxID=1502 RepID=UPI0013E34A54|nr:B-box zinc finger protein [Clostridium perfringens]MBI6048932.1 B-box zinc finger protein [Clostridium perfringens]MDJ8927800.1 B-box zinc finger protein [Clostridium perfringens]MDJ8930697.1 B-box zinc finger protein [Clostridium perfringens]MDJ8936470.1 B-box zinc finger protein [Clostridium perfringens]MDJ8954043.1 B-box zinc finger protein [Clostridium perfringens]
MNCYKHQDKKAISICEKCNRFICDECEVKLGNKSYCKDCIEIASKNSKSNKNLTSKNTVNNCNNNIKIKVNNLKNIVEQNYKYENNEKYLNLRNNYKDINIILAIISIIFLLLKCNWIYSYITEGTGYVELGFIGVIFQILYVSISIMIVVILLVLTLLLVKNFIPIDYKIRMVTPLLTTILFGIIVFFLQVLNPNFGFNILHCLIDLIPATFITLGTYLNKDYSKLDYNYKKYYKYLIYLLAIFSIIFALPLIEYITDNFSSLIESIRFCFQWGFSNIFFSIINLSISIIGIAPIFILSLILIKQFITIDYKKLLLISLLVLCVSPISTNKIQFIFEYGLFDMFRLKETMMFVPSITLIIIGTYLEYNLKKSLSNKIEVNNE